VSANVYGKLSSRYVCMWIERECLCAENSIEIEIIGLANLFLLKNDNIHLS
jgi:hypothetical protein